VSLRPGHTLRIIEILGGLMELKSPFSEHLDRAAPTMTQLIVILRFRPGVSDSLPNRFT